MYKVLASAEVWHAGLQLCCRDDPEVIVMAGVCVLLGWLKAGQGSGRSCSFCEGF